MESRARISAYVQRPHTSYGESFWPQRVECAHFLGRPAPVRAGLYQQADNAQRAYGLPADAEPDDTTNWIIADDITTSVKLMAARYVLIVSDSCYSGRL